MTRTEAFKKHIRIWSGCDVCTIGSWAFKHVFGSGSLKAPFVFVGEGPGVSEDAVGQPFVGPSGKLLYKALTEAGFGEDDFFLTNLVACRPCDGPMEDNRPPEPIEVLNCSPRLNTAITIVRPKVLVAVGRVPSQSLSEKWKLWNFIEFFESIPHPAWVLRQGGIKGPAYLPFFNRLEQIRRRVV